MGAWRKIIVKTNHHDALTKQMTQHKEQIIYDDLFWEATGCTDASDCQQLFVGFHFITKLVTTIQDFPA
ncbi:hypothetical protein FC756_23345 [Lysinibacillus mangiferihumi]|uniref:Uncharacterized protein n=1 Tax=Lysinibacillus mangiferihumi TaxID=1130819 RepID=A0A4V5TI54_9BACI|nr:hypothetical protein [Lysinibacillus mangiferihumi]TKI53563.1 hypothetical protein FC756_23345 [Lysinibacillus mangiferihumi]